MGAVPLVLKARKRLEQNCFVAFAGDQSAGKTSLVHALVDVEVNCLLLTCILSRGMCMFSRGDAAQALKCIFLCLHAASPLVF